MPTAVDGAQAEEAALDLSDLDLSDSVDADGFPLERGWVADPAAWDAATRRQWQRFVAGSKVALVDEKQWWDFNDKDDNILPPTTVDLNQ